MKKFKMFFDIEKEELWLNEQLQKAIAVQILADWAYTLSKKQTTNM